MKQTCSDQLTDELVTATEKTTTNQLERSAQLWTRATQTAASIEPNHMTRTLRGNIADDAVQMDVHKTLNLFYPTRKCPMLRCQSRKNASLAAVVRYINITTIYTVGYLQIFNAGHFYSSKHCHDLW